MKILFKSLCVSVVLTLVFSFIPFEGECRDISSNVLRVHILANSDSEEDQRLKLKVRDALITKSEMLFADAHSKEEAIAVTSENLPELLNTAKSVILSEGYDYDVSARIANIYFDTRYYEDVTMPGGYYDALQIRIGEAKGKNWWCVMYPSLCLFSASKSETLDSDLSTKQYEIVKSEGEYEFRFRILEIFYSIIDFFS